MDDGTTLEEFVSNPVFLIDEVVKTGLVVKLIIENTEYDSLTIIVRGNTNEYGIEDVSDKVKLVNYILKKISTLN